MDGWVSVTGVCLSKEFVTSQEGGVEAMKKEEKEELMTTNLAEEAYTADQKKASSMMSELLKHQK